MSITLILVILIALAYMLGFWLLMRERDKGIKVYADERRAIYKDADSVLLDWHEMRALSDTHEATLIDVKKL